jgi:hypothetical protein
MTAGRIARELLWTNQFFPIDIIPLWFSTLICHLGDEQQDRWWAQFRDVVSPHGHDHHNQEQDPQFEGDSSRSLSANEKLQTSLYLISYF